MDQMKMSAENDNDVDALAQALYQQGVIDKGYMIAQKPSYCDIPFSSQLVFRGEARKVIRALSLIGQVPGSPKAPDRV